MPLHLFAETGDHSAYDEIHQAIQERLERLKAAATVKAADYSYGNSGLADAIHPASSGRNRVDPANRTMTNDISRKKPASVQSLACALLVRGREARFAAAD